MPLHSALVSKKIILIAVLNFSYYHTGLKMYLACFSMNKLNNAVHSELSLS